MVIQKFTEVMPTHMDLLLLADPNSMLVEEYMERGFCFEMRKEDQLIGVLILLETRPKTIEIVNLAIKELKQGKGYGEKLIQYAIQYAKENDYHEIEIGTGSTSIGQLYLYQKCGFRMTHIDIDFFTRNYPVAIYENGLLLQDMVRLSQSLK